MSLFATTPHSPGCAIRTATCTCGVDQPQASAEADKELHRIVDALSAIGEPWCPTCASSGKECAGCVRGIKREAIDYWQRYAAQKVREDRRKAAEWLRSWAADTHPTMGDPDNDMAKWLRCAASSLDQGEHDAK